MRNVAKIKLGGEGEDDISDTLTGLLPISWEQEFRNKLKIMCRYKSRESYLMLTSSIQKEYAIAYSAQSKIENPILSFLI